MAKLKKYLFIFMILFLFLFFNNFSVKSIETKINIIFPFLFFTDLKVLPRRPVLSKF